MYRWGRNVQLPGLHGVIICIAMPKGFYHIIVLQTCKTQVGVLTCPASVPPKAASYKKGIVKCGKQTMLHGREGRRGRWYVLQQGTGTCTVCLVLQ